MKKIVIAIIVVIILIGAVVWLFIGPNLRQQDQFRAEAAALATKSMLNQIRPGISICCGTPGNELNPNIKGDAGICVPSVGVRVPTADELFADSVTYEITADCTDVSPTITATIQNHRKKACDGVWTISEIGIDYPPDC